MDYEVLLLIRDYPSQEAYCTIDCFTCKQRSLSNILIKTRNLFDLLSSYLISIYNKNELRNYPWLGKLLKIIYNLLLPNDLAITCLHNITKINSYNCRVKHNLKQF